MPKVHVIAIDDHPRRTARMEFDVDFSTGVTSDLVVAGMNPDDAAAQLKDIAKADAAHFAWQQSYPTPAPLRMPRHLAWHLLARGWRLEGKLGRFNVPHPSPLPKGTIA